MTKKQKSHKLSSQVKYWIYGDEITFKQFKGLIDLELIDNLTVTMDENTYKLKEIK